MTKSEFITKCNNERKTNKNKWCNFRELVDNHNVGIKFFNTWIQVIEVDGIRSTGTMDCSVKKFNEDLNNALNF